jgi:hypothetical protein
VLARLRFSVLHRDDATTPAVTVALLRSLRATPDGAWLFDQMTAAVLEEVASHVSDRS